MWTFLGCFLFSFIAMEGVAYATHRWLMHGPLWNLHASHHRPREHALERNDWFALFFAVPSMTLIALGVYADRFFLPFGLGMTAYGAVYFLCHDLLVHRRFSHRFRPRRGYLERIVRAHRIHHRTRERDGAVAFGFLIVPSIARLEATTRGPARRKTSADA